MRNTLLKILGANPAEYRLLLKTDRQVRRRSEASKAVLSNSPVFWVVLYVLSSSFVAFVGFSFFASDRFGFTFLTLFASMTMLAFTVVPRFQEVINPSDYPMLAHLPVSSRTYFLVKIRLALVQVTVFAVALAVPPAIFGIWMPEGSVLFAAIYLLVSLLATFFVIGLISAFYGSLIKLYRWHRFRDLVTYSQALLAILVPVCFYLLPRLIPTFYVAGGDSDQIAALKWVYVLPPSWFAGLLHFGLGAFQPTFLYLSVLAVAATVSLLVVPLRRISLKYAEHLSFLQESASGVQRISRRSLGRVAKLLKNTEMRAAFQLASIYLRNDRNTKVRLFGKLGVSLAAVVPVIPIIPELMGHPFSIGLAIGIPIHSFCVSAYALSCLLSILRYSEDYQATWLFTIVPMASQESFFKGAKLATIAYFVVPYYIILMGIYVVLWHPFSALVYILPSLIGSLCYLSFCEASMVSLPFSQKPQEKKGIDDLVTFLLALTVFSAVLGIQYAAYQFHIYLYIAVYAATIGFGIILSKRRQQPAKELVMQAS